MTAALRPSIYRVLAEFVLMLAQQPAPRYINGLTKAQHERRVETLRELDEPSLPEWAGRYADCVIAPRAGFVQVIRTCMQSVSVGSVRAHGNRLEITFEGEPPQVARVWWSVPWGSRRYLIPESCLPQFCLEVNDGREPRLTICGYPLMRLGSGFVAGGKPELPEPWNLLVLDTPLETCIVAVERRVVEPTPFSRGMNETRVTLPLGRRDGVRKDLGFHLGGDAWTHGFVESVDPFACVVLASETSRRRAKGLRIGDYAGTRPRK